MRIDSHQHFWRYRPSDYPWIPESAVVGAGHDTLESCLDRDFLPDDLRPLLQAAGLDGSIAVQARQSLQENEFLLDLADQNELILGVVGWIDLRSEDVDAQAARFAAHPKAVGVRHVVQDESQPMFMAGVEFRRGIACLSQHGLTYDILIYEHQLADAVALVQAFPDQTFVLDHIAKPNIRSGQIAAWQSQIRKLAAFANVVVKVSGMVTEAEHQRWETSQLEPYWNSVLEAFGPRRILFGSDWPVIRLSSTYERWIALVNQWLAPLSPTEQAAIWGENAHRIYLPGT
jgi:L-fuconolactonase